LFQQNQGVADIIRIGSGMRRDNFFDARGQAPRPASGLGGVLGLSALFHADNKILGDCSNLVTGFSELSGEIGAMSPQPPQDLPRVLAIAKKFGLEFLPPHGA
jgi:hypothetical protein